MKIDDPWDSIVTNPTPAPAPEAEAPTDGASVDATIANLERRYAGQSCTFDDLEHIVTQTLAALPALDLDVVREEMMNMTVEVNDDPTPHEIASALARVQGYKDRLTAILNQVERESSLRKRMMDMLIDANNVVSKASSVDKRRGEAVIRYPMLMIRMEQMLAFRSEVMSFVMNMRSRGDVLSRQASILDMQIRLGERVRTGPNGYGIEAPAEEMTGGVKEMPW